MVLINVWSGPRTCSTALMYSFAQRGQMDEKLVVVDEPLYASYLQLTGLPRPYRDQVLAAQSHDGNAVMESLRAAAKEKHVYCKQMGKFLHAIERRWLREGVHVVLVRDPLSVVASFSEVLTPSLEETCYPSLCTIVSELRSAGSPVVVVMSEDLVQRPEATLRALCGAIGLAWDPAMLRWEAGPKPYDGCWASYWYRAVHQSRGWESTASEKPRPQIPDHLKPLLHECCAMYELLLPYALNPQPFTLAKAPSSCSDAAPRTSKPPQTGSTHAFKADPRNADILVGMRDSASGLFTLCWRPFAKVSVLDSGFMLGDGVWEGLRVHKGVIMFAREHLERLYQGAKALAMDIGLEKQQLQANIYKTLDANGMRHATGVHVRLMVTRGLKPTPYQNPNITIGQPTIVILPEWKVLPETEATCKVEGMRLSTVHVRRGAADVQDPTLNSHSKLNCIAACIQANAVGADEGLMLDPAGFVATCNSVNFFIVVKVWPTVLSKAQCEAQEECSHEVWCPTGKYQLHGVTRRNVILLCERNGIVVREKDFSLNEVYSAAEAFTTGTFAGVLPVREVDGRQIGTGEKGHICAQLQELYALAMDAQAEQGRLHLF